MKSSVLQLHGLNKSYGALRATNDVSLSVKSGEIHALIGPNGAGKTTLIKQIFGSERPDSGRILLNGEDVTRLSVPQRVRRGIGRSFQISNLLMDFTICENAIIAAQACRKEAFQFFAPAFEDRDLISDAMLILDSVGLTDKSDTKVSALAHGERRLLELALAMAGEPCLLLLDEPMAGAGPQESQHMTSIIKGLRAHHAILLIEHDMDAVFTLADRITVLVEGAVIAQGDSTEISQNSVVTEAYLGREDELC